MVTEGVLIGRIIKLEGLKIVFEVTEEDIADKIFINMGTVSFLISINGLVYAAVPDGRKAIAKIVKIYDKDTFSNDSFFNNKSKHKYIIEADLIGIYDDYYKRFGKGINTFPIVGDSVYSIDLETYKNVHKINSKFLLEVGKSYLNNEIPVFANPDILLGKHLGVFGNTGTGKTCTVASIIQGLKRRLHKDSIGNMNINPKIIIFDCNGEYESAFNNTEFKVRLIKKNELRLPHYYLSYTEYYKLVNASQGAQAPTLKAAIEKLRLDNGDEDENKFRFRDLPSAISNYIENEGSTEFNRNQMTGWNFTMVSRIERIIEDENMISIIDPDDEVNTVGDIIKSDDEITIIEADFDKDEIDIIMFLFSKLLYQAAVKNRLMCDNKNVVVIFEEAHRYINNKDSDDYKLGNYYIERLAREGRKFGISLIISSQRPSELSTTVLSQCNSFIIHRLTNKSDLDFVYKVLRTDDQDLINFISGMEKQYAVAVGEAFGYSEIIKISTACPTPRCDDPKVINSWMESDEISDAANTAEAAAAKMEQ